MILDIEKIAYHLQDPFKNRPSDVRVTDIADTIEIKICELLNEEVNQKQRPNHRYYVM